MAKNIERLGTLNGKKTYWNNELSMSFIHEGGKVVALAYDSKNKKNKPYRS